MIPSIIPINTLHESIVTNDVIGFFSFGCFLIVSIILHDLPNYYNIKYNFNYNYNYNCVKIIIPSDLHSYNTKVPSCVPTNNF